MNTGNSTSSKKSVLVISSHVVRGTVGNRAVAFALEALGHPAWILPTVTLPWHPGHGSSTRVITPSNDFTNLCADLANSPWPGEISGVISGFLANGEQAAIVAELIACLRKNNPDLVYLCDPVIGDAAGVARYGNSGRLYVADETAESIRNILLPLADITTPNMFELSWLTGQNTPNNQSQMLTQSRKFASDNNIDHVLVTSVPGLMRGCVGSVLINGQNAIMSEHKAFENSPNGLGDLTSALFMSHHLDKISPEKILEKTTASVFEILARTLAEGADELALESNIISLSRPMAMITMRTLK